MQEIHTILVPVDFSDNASKLLRGAAYVANRLNAKLDVVFVVETLRPYSGFTPALPCRTSHWKGWNVN